jgi:hypothetical protein
MFGRPPPVHSIVQMFLFRALSNAGHAARVEMPALSGLPATAAEGRSYALPAPELSPSNQTIITALATRTRAAA